MAEVIAAFGAISSVLQVVEFAAKVASHAHELIVAGKDALRENIEIARLVREYECLGDTSCHQGTNEEKAISRLGEQCRKEAQNLLKELHTLQMSEGSSGLRRLREGSRKAARAVRKRKEVERARRLLQELNGQLSTALLQRLLAKHDEQNTRRSSGSGRGATPFDAMQLTKVVDVVGKSDRDDVGTIGLLVERLDRAAHQRIIDGLAFPEMSSRREAIIQAYPRTFGQVLRDPTMRFREWLQNEGGIFWISGKAGSGKSTLMKYICNEDITRELLQEWSGEKELVFANYYFWFLGRTLEKSIDGLLRSILHQILRERPELTRSAFPKQSIIDANELKPIQWDHNELLEAVYAISRSKSDPENAKRFCFFIDGLDEYQGNHVELVGLLKSLSAHPDVKLCVSSRPWNAFVDAFESAVPTIQLDKVTRKDHEEYVYGMLEVGGAMALTRPRTEQEEITALADEIVDRAEGVFLWVMLVVRSVLRGLGEGDPIPILRCHVQDFPTDLYEFFQNILGRVNKAYRHQTSQALMLAFLEFNRPNDTRTSAFVDYWLLLQDPKGLLSPSFAYEMQITPVSEDKSQKMRRDTRAFLSACCKDLLTFPSIPCAGSSWSGKVSLLHRTVYDFLKSDDIQSMLHDGLPQHFRDHTVFELLDLARIKFSVHPVDYEVMMPMVKRVSQTILQTCGHGLPEDYVTHAEAAVQYQFSIFLSETGSAAFDRKLATVFNDGVEPMTFLAARQNQKFARAMSIQDFCIPESKNLHAEPRWTSVITAAMGECELNRFALDKVDMGFLKFFVESFKVDLNYPFIHDGSKRSLWQRLLDKSAHSATSDVTHSRFVREVVKLFRDNGAVME